MPHLLHGLPAAQRQSTVEALVHFLASQGGPIDQRSSGSSLSQIEQGKALYHSVGCVSCHKPFEPPPQQKIDPLTLALRQAAEDDPELLAELHGTPIGQVVPLGNQAMKTTVQALAEFLADPLRVRPSGRMPSLALQPREAQALAAYLLREQYSKKESAPGVGLDFAYYQGNWPRVPEFETLTPQLEGTAKGFDPKQIKLENGKAPQSNFAVRFQGLIQVPQDGLYRFWTKSDDGSLLKINGKLVVENDGTHAPQERSGTIMLTKGRHPLEVGFAQGGGGYELSVDWQVPGGKRQRIPPGVLLHSAAAMIPQGIVDFQIDPEKANRGKMLFATVGCASCHSIGPQPPREHQNSLPKDDPPRNNLAKDTWGILSQLPAKPLSQLDLEASGGCLSKKVAQGRPLYTLTKQERSALRQAVLNLRTDKAPLPPEKLVDRTLTTFNCYTCHRRGDQGGPTPKQSDYFTYEVMVDLGDEGRLPPHLHEVGAKLTEKGFSDTLFHAQRYRTYMATRMPQYGQDNLGHLPAAFAKADQGKIPPYKPQFSSRLIDDGRQLVGNKKLSCINCHSWGGMKIQGAEGMDFIRAAQRLQPEWFHAFLKDPQRLKPRTRMPTAWPDGKSLYPDIQDGNVDRQIDAIWAYLSVGQRGGTPPGLSPDDKTLLAPFDDPIVFRTFLDGVSAHAILVGFRQRTHVAFDANRVRMVLGWTGDFISAKPSWEGRAGQYAKIAGSNAVQFPDGPPLAVLKSFNEAWPEDVPKSKPGASRTPPGWRFRGYQFDENRIPTFLYEINQMKVRETPSTDYRENASLIIRTFELTSPKPISDLYLRVATGLEIDQQGETYLVDEQQSFRIQSSPDSQPSIRQTKDRQELILPVKFSAENGAYTARVQIKLTW